VTMADGTNWKVERVADDPVEARFQRDAEVALGEPFSLLLFLPTEGRRVRITLGKVVAIRIGHT
jgi:hypothetical protein